jgi:uncharacterized membrane protein YphA (DoxX/SURF4 family)
MWIEKDISPEISLQKTFAHALYSLSIAFVWIYHGLVPKLIYRNADEIRMLHESGFANSYILKALSILGIVEICIGLSILIFWKSRRVLWGTILLMVLATLGVAANSPHYLAGAFNPITLNFSVAALSGISLITGINIPTADNCMRKPPGEDR